MGIRDVISGRSGHVTRRRAARGRRFNHISVTEYY